MALSDDQRKAMFANMANPRSKRKSKKLKRPKSAKSGSSSSRKLPRRLPVVTIQGVKYFQDARLKEFRAVDDPHKRISYKDHWPGSVFAKSPRRLSVVTILGVQYFQDDRLKEFRAVDDPHKRISYKDRWPDSLFSKLNQIRIKQSEAIKKKIKSKSNSKYIPKEPWEGARKHKLMTVELRKKIPKLYSQEHIKDPVVHAKFFSPYSGYTLYVTEFDGKDLLFGYASGVSYGGDEWGYTSLNEIAKTNRNGLPLVERDKYFNPKKFSETRVGKALKIVKNPGKREHKRIISSLIGRQDFTTKQLEYWVKPYKDELKIVEVDKPKRWSGDWRTLYMIESKK